MWRVVTTIALLACGGGIRMFMSNTGTLISGESSVLQLRNSDLSFLAANQGMYWGHVINNTSVLLIAILLILIWFKPIKNLFTA